MIWPKKPNGLKIHLFAPQASFFMLQFWITVPYQSSVNTGEGSSEWLLLGARKGQVKHNDTDIRYLNKVATPLWQLHANSSINLHIYQCLKTLKTWTLYDYIGQIMTLRCGKTIGSSSFISHYQMFQTCLLQQIKNLLKNVRRPQEIKFSCLDLR